MALSDRSYSQRPPSSNGLPFAVKWMLIVNSAIFVLAFFSQVMSLTWVRHVILDSSGVLQSLKIWQLVTYAFVHLDPISWLFNGITLYFFGAMMERMWGTDRFLKFFLSCAVGGAILGILGSFLFGGGVAVGSAAGTLGLIVAFGVLFADEQVYFFFAPIKAKYLAMIVGLLAFFQAFSNPFGGIVHIGGGLTGLLLVLQSRKGGLSSAAGMFGRSASASRSGPSWIEQLRTKYRDWKIERRRRQFQVYLKKQNSDRDRFN